MDTLTEKNNTRINSSLRQCKSNRSATKNQGLKTAKALGSTPKELDQLTLFSAESAEPAASIEPASHWQGCYCLVVRQRDLVWRLVPALRRREAERLLNLLIEWGIEWTLNENHGVPVDGVRINAIAEAFIDKQIGGGAV
jgi:hypothetical protein